MTILSKLSKGIAVTAVATGISLSPIASSNISHAATGSNFYNSKQQCSWSNE